MLYEDDRGVLFRGQAVLLRCWVEKRQVVCHVKNTGRRAAASRARVICHHNPARKRFDRCRIKETCCQHRQQALNMAAAVFANRFQRQPSCANSSGRIPAVFHAQSPDLSHNMQVKGCTLKDGAAYFQMHRRNGIKHRISDILCEKRHQAWCFCDTNSNVSLAAVCCRGLWRALKLLRQVFGCWRMVLSSKQA